LGRGALAGLACAAALAAAGARGGEVETDYLRVYEEGTFHGDLVVTQQSSQGSLPTNGLVLYYTFGADQTPVPDDSGSGNSGTVYEATYTSSGKINGGAYDFDGSDAIYTAPVGYFANKSNVTAAAWVKSEGSQSTWAAIVFNRDGGSWPNMLWVLEINNDSPKKPAFVVYTSTFSSQAKSSSELPVGEWVHLAGTFDGASVKLYRNGALESTISHSGPMLNQQKPVYVGRNAADAVTFNGLIDEVTVYDRVLSSNEIYNLYLYNGTNSYPKVRMRVAGSAEFCEGIEYVVPLGDLEMGPYTNRP
jgi:hypothetical protein